MKSVHVSQIKANLNNINLIDIRESIEFSALPKLSIAKHIPMDTLVQNPEMFLEKEKCYYLICRSGARTSNVTQYLSHLGYNVVNVEGGMLEYYNG
ncbi:MAG: rhodanese-like domain-containing protein [Turicibacter sp.]|nr:rhodanese-like domain-containing protein [Turicibacter sp.]